MAFLEISLAPRKQVDQLCGIESMTNVKVRQSGLLGISIPGADGLAVITAIDPVADQGSQRRIDRTRMLNRQLRNATSGIKLIWTNKGIGRADVKTLRAGPTVSL